MTALSFQHTYGASYFPPILKEQEGMKKFAREALVDRLLKFNIFPNDSLFVTRTMASGRVESVIPDINNKLSSAVKRWLSQLVATPTGFALYDFIANSDARMEVCRGTSTYIYTTDDGVNRIVIKEGEIDEDGPKTAIAQKTTGEIFLFSIPSVIGFGH